MKQFFKQFFQTVRKSIHNPEWYGEVLERPLGKGVKYLLSLTIFVVLAQAIIFVVITVPFWGKIHSAVLEIQNQVADIFPTDLVVTLANGEASINMPEPYAIPFPEGWRENLASDPQSPAPKNIIVFETGKSIERGDFQALDTAILVGKNEIGMYDTRQDKVDTRSLSGTFKDGVLDKSTYLVLVNEAWGWLRLMLPILIVVGAPLVMGVMFATACPA